ncbi:MAG: hypothetical protein AAGC53_22580 [Actinomycetota bacterium]
MAAPLDPACVFANLAEHEVDYVLIGGLAAVLHGSTAMTNDADIVPDPAPANLGRLATALRSLDARLRVPETPNGLPFEPHPALLGSMRVLNLTTRCGDLDLAAEPAGIESYALLEQNAIVFRVTGQRVRVAALADIIRSKEAAGRPKDHATLPILRALEQEIAQRSPHGDPPPGG